MCQVRIVGLYVEWMSLELLVRAPANLSGHNENAELEQCMSASEQQINWRSSMLTGERVKIRHSSLLFPIKHKNPLDVTLQAQISQGACQDRLI